MSLKRISNPSLKFLLREMSQGDSLGAHEGSQGDGMVRDGEWGDKYTPQKRILYKIAKVEDLFRVDDDKGRAVGRNY